MKLKEFTASLNEEQLRFLIAHFCVAPITTTDAEQEHFYHCQRGQLKEAAIDALESLGFSEFDSR